jgi:DsbC/DsbD-like thiol-disulfide interchange protein
MKTSAGTDYGYEGNVVLLSTFSIPATVQPGTDLPLVGDLRWLVCHDICIPQRTELKASMRVSDAATVDNHARALLVAAAERIPKPLPEALHLTASSSRDALRLSFTLPGNLTSAIFFPAEPEQIDNAAPQQLASIGEINQLELKKSDHLQRDPERLQGVLVFNGQDAYQVDVPIHRSVVRKEKKQ